MLNKSPRLSQNWISSYKHAFAPKLAGLFCLVFCFVCWPIFNNLILTFFNLNVYLMFKAKWLQKRSNDVK